MKVTLLLLLLAVASSKAQLVTYLFPENKDITICPSITSSDTLPSFKLEPISATGHDQFLIGSYEVSDTGMPRVNIAQENVSCTNNSAYMCTQLTVRFGGDRRRLGRDSFIVTYTAANGVTREIRVNFGYVGVYLLNETPGLVVGRQPNLTVAANNSLVIFGTINRRVTCLENGTEAPSNLLIFAPKSFSNDICFGNNQQQTNSQPGLLRIIFLANHTGQERIYFVDSTDSDCSSDKISDTFLFIFDPPSIEDPDPPTTEPTTSIEPTRSPPIATEDGIAIGVSVGVGAVIFLAVVVLLISLVIWYCCCHKKKDWNVEDGPGARSKTSSVSSTVDGPEVPSGSPTLLLPSNTSNGRVRRQISTPIKKELHVLTYESTKAMDTIQETLAELNEDSYGPAATQENGYSQQTYMTNIIKAGHRVVIILDGHKEHMNSSDDNVAVRWIRALISFPIYSNMRLDNVFVVLLGCIQPASTFQLIPGLQPITISQHPDNDNFDPLSVAKLIHKEIVKRSPLSQPQRLQTNLPAPPPTTSSGSRTPADLANVTPLIRHNPGAVPSSEHSGASSAEPSQSSLINDDTENLTGQNIALDTTETDKGVVLNKSTATGTEFEGKRGSKTPANARAANVQGEESSLKSSSAPQLVHVEPDKLKVLLKEVVHEENKAVVEGIKDQLVKASEDIKNNIGEVKDDVGHVADLTELARGEIQNLQLTTVQPYNEDDDGVAQQREDPA